MTQDNLNRLVDMLKRHEGFKPTLYLCPTGHLTIGYGHNCEAHDDVAKYENRTLTIDEAHNLLLNDLSEAQKDCVKFIRTFPSYSDIQQCVLLDMCFNMGVGALLKFKKMLKAFTTDDHKGIVREMINSAWHKQVPHRANELIFMIMTEEWI